MYHQWRNYVILDSFLYSWIFRNLLIKSRERKNYVKFFLFVEKLWNFPSFWIFCEISKISKVLKFVKFSRSSTKSSISYDPWNLANKLSIINKKHDYRFCGILMNRQDNLRTRDKNTKNSEETRMLSTNGWIPPISTPTLRPFHPKNSRQCSIQEAIIKEARSSKRRIELTAKSRFSSWSTFIEKQ